MSQFFASVALFLYFDSLYFLILKKKKRCIFGVSGSDCCLPGSSVHGTFPARILNWLPFPFPGDLPASGIEVGSPALQADSLPSEPPGNSQQQQPKKKMYFGRSLVLWSSSILPRGGAGWGVRRMWHSSSGSLSRD